MYHENIFNIKFYEYSIEEFREDMDRLVKYFRDKEYHSEAMQSVSDYRQLPLSILDESEAFFVDEDLDVRDFPDWIKESSLGFCDKDYCAMSGRCVFPVKDVKGHTMGLCGWDPFVQPKYLDSKNYGYKAKLTSFYGMEKMEEYYTSGKQVFVTEGLMCTLYLRSKGFQALARLGSWMTPYSIQILRRFGTRLVMVPDNDEAGNSMVRQCKRELPKSAIIQVRYGKDIDGCRKEDEHKYEEQLLKELKSLDNPFTLTDILIRR